MSRWKCSPIEVPLVWNFLGLNHQMASCKIRAPGRILVLDYYVFGALECLRWYALQLIEGKGAQLSRH